MARYTTAQSMWRIRKELRHEKRQSDRLLKGVIVGRALKLQNEDSFNQRRPLDIDPSVRYRSIGQRAVVYIFRPELKEYRGVSYFNARQVEHAIEQGAVTAAQRARVVRSELRLTNANKKFGNSNVYWVSAIAESATIRSGDDRLPINMAKEELSIANALFDDEWVATGPPHLWLGAICARSAEGAEKMLGPLETMMPKEMSASMVRLLPGQS